MLKLHWVYLNYVASLILTGVTSLGLGTFVLLKNRSSSLNKVFFVFSVFIAIFGFSQSLIYYNPVISWIGSVIEHLAVPFIAVLFFHFVTILTNRPNKKLLKFIYAQGVFWSIFGGFSKSVIIGLRPHRGAPDLIMPYSTTAGPAYIYYLLSFAIVVIYGTYILYREYKISSGARRNQLKYMFVGAIVGFTGGGINFLYPYKIYSYPFNPFSTYLIPIYIFIAAYAIVKHRLMDIKVVLGRTGLLILIYGVIIYACFQFVAIFKPYLEEVFKNRWIYFPIAMYTVLITIAPFFYLYLQKKMEDKIFKKQRQYQKTLMQLSAGMTKIRNLNKLLDLTVIQIVRAVRLNHATIFLYNKDKDKYVLMASRGEFKKRLGIELEADNSLVKYLSITKKPLFYYDMQKTEIETVELKNMLAQLSSAVCIPGFIEERLVGFLLLGEKLSNETYTQEDIDTFITLTNQAVLAIDNALSYQELMDTKDQLVNQERLATLGEFASEVAHEIKNPLQAIKTFTELINEKYNDKAFREKFSKLAALEIDRIDNFVRQLIRFSHPLPPKFELVDINEALDSVLELMENDLINKNILVKKQYQAQQIKITADKNQLKQVFINLITNAIEAMQNSTKRILTVSTSSLDSHIIIKITDIGCGIPAENIPKLFDPLFTTKEKGSGLGLSIVETIIKSHKGKIDVESKVGEGTTFTIMI